MGSRVQIAQAVPATILPANSTLHIGVEQVGSNLIGPFQRAVDELRIYSRALNAAEVAHLDARPGG